MLQGNEGVRVGAKIDQVKAEVKQAIKSGLEEVNAEGMIIILNDLLEIKSIGSSHNASTFMKMVIGMGVLEFELVLSEWLAEKQQQSEREG